MNSEIWQSNGIQNTKKKHDQDTTNFEEDFAAFFGRIHRKRFVLCFYFFGDFAHWAALFNMDVC